MVLFPEEQADALPTPCKSCSTLRPFILEFILTFSTIYFLTSLYPIHLIPSQLDFASYLFTTPADKIVRTVYEDEHSGAYNSIAGSSKSDFTSDTWLCSPSEYEQYLSRSLPTRVQRELERDVQREFGFVGDAVQTRKVVDMVQKLQLRLFRQFQQGTTTRAE
jgi:hypothetical protein